MNIKTIVKSRTTKNASWLIGGKIIQMVIALFVGLLTARYLGPSNYGLVNYGLAYSTFFSSLCTLGINSVLVKELLDNKDNEGMVIGTSLVMKLVASVFSLMMILGIVSVIDKNENTTIIVVFLCALGVVFSIFDTFNYWFQSNLESKYVAIATLIGYLATSAYRILLLYLGSSIYFFALATSVDFLVVGILLCVFYKVNHGKKISFSIKYAKVILGKSWHFILPGIMVAIYSQTDRLMLKQFISATEVGYYSVAVVICNMWVFVLNAIIDSFVPTIMELYNENKIDLFIRRNKQLYCIVFYLSVFVSLCFFVLSKFIVVLLYGEAYLSAAPILKIITWYTAFSFLGVARNAWIVSNNKQKYIVWTYVSAALLNIVINMILIPEYGAVGAAVASLIAQIIATLVVPLFIKPLRENTIMIAEAILFKGIK